MFSGQQTYKFQKKRNLVKKLWLTK